MLGGGEDGVKSRHVMDQILKDIVASPPSPEKSPGLYAELSRAARRIRETERKVIALFPSGPKVGVPTLALQLAWVLADVAEGSVALIDANTRFPGYASLVNDRQRPQSADLVETWLSDFLMLLTPIPDRPTGLDLGPLDRIVASQREFYAHLLLDMTGFDEVGEHWGTFRLVDGVLIIGHPGATSERELRRMNEAIPATKNLGVLLVG